MARRAEHFLVWGGGGHGKVVAEVVRACGHTVVGFVDADPEKHGRVVEPGGARVLLGQAELEERTLRGEPILPNIDAIALAIGANAKREACLRLLDGYHIPALVHPAASVSSSASFGRGAVVFAGSLINAEAWVGAAAIVNTGAIVEHDCQLGNAVHVSSGATLSGGVRVGERTWIGAGATVIQGITIGADTVVGAGAVIIRDVPAGVTIVGNPGRILHR